MKYNPKVIMVVLAIAIVLVLVIGTVSHGLKQKHDSAPPSSDSSLQTEGDHSNDPISEYTESQDLPIPPVNPKDPIESSSSESQKADLEFNIGDYRPKMDPSAETNEI